MKELLGKTIIKIENASDQIKFYTSDKKVLTYSAYGDCCANSYIESFDNKYWLIGTPILSTEVFTLDTVEYDSSVIDYYRYEISTKNGTASIELRCEHNGYYSGWIGFDSEKDVE